MSPRQWEPEALVKRVFLLAVAGIGLQIAAILVIMR